MVKPGFIYTGIVFGVLILHMIIADIGGFFTAKINSFLGIVIYFLVMLYAVYAYRKEYCDNQISFGHAFGFTVYLSLLVGILISAFNYLYLNFISPDLGELVRIMSEEAMIERGVPEDSIEQAMEMRAKFQTLPWMVLFGTLTYLLMGLIMGVIGGAILKKEPKNPFEGVE